MIDLAAAGIIANPHGAAEQRVACPQCAKNSRDTALGVNIEDGRYHCFRCGWKGRAGDSQSYTPPPRVAQINDPLIAQRKRERLQKTWRESVPLSHQSARAVCQYLESRALGEILKAPPVVLKAHPALEYWDGARSLGKYPAMVALFAGAAGAPTTLHCTWLRSDGCAKAAVPSPKKILGVPLQGATRGGAIRLYEPRGGVLGVAEGIETALSLHLLCKIPTWAAFCADNIERIRLPERLRELRIAIDIDESGKGRAVAEALTKRVKRWSPRTRVIYMVPELDGPGDLNDELRRRAG